MIGQCYKMNQLFCYFYHFQSPKIKKKVQIPERNDATKVHGGYQVEGTNQDNSSNNITYV